MISRIFRITRRSRIEFIIKKGAKVRGRLVRVLYLPNRIDHARFAVIIPGRFIKIIVERNRMKRRITEALRECIPLVTAACYDVIVIPIVSLLKTPFTDIQTDIKHVLRKII